MIERMEKASEEYLSSWGIKTSCAFKAIIVGKRTRGEEKRMCGF